MKCGLQRPVGKGMWLFKQVRYRSAAATTTMSTFAKSNFSAGNYQKFRPVYPQKFYDFLRSHFTEKPSLAVELGCGTGQATVAISSLADKVIAIDNSKTMIDQANQANHPNNISFRVGNDATLTHQVEPLSVDLITVAAAAHWFDLPTFYPAAHKILKPNGILAIWGYCDQSIQGYPKFAEIAEKYSYDERYMAAFWDKGRDKIHEFYSKDKIPADLFRDVEYRFNSSEALAPDEKLEICKKMTLADLKSYFGTYSAYHNWLEAHPDRTKNPDILDAMFDEILEATKLSMDSEVTVKWNTVYMIGRK